MLDLAAEVLELNPFGTARSHFGANLPGIRFLFGPQNRSARFEKSSKKKKNTYSGVPGCKVLSIYY